VSNQLPAPSRPGFGGDVEEYRELLDALPVMITFLDIESRLIGMNRAAEEALGITLAANLGKPLAAFTVPELAEKYRRDHIEILSTGQPMRGVIESFLGADGERRWAQADKLPLRNRQGEITGLVIYALDITDRVRTQGRLARLNRLYDTLSRSGEMMVRATSAQTLYEMTCQIAVRDGHLRLAWVGLLDPEQNLLFPVAKAGQDEGYLSGLEVLLHPLAKGRGPTYQAVTTGVYSVVSDYTSDPRIGPWRPSGIARGFRSSAAFPLRQGGRVVGAISLYADEIDYFQEEETGLLSRLADNLSFALSAIAEAEERRRAESDLRASELRFRRIFENSAIGVALVDDAGRCVAANKALQKLLGYGAEELTALPFSAFTHPDDQGSDKALLDELLAGWRDGYQIEKRFLRKTGEIICARLTASLASGIDVHPQNTIALVEDVTEQRQAEAEVRKLNAELEDRVKERTLQLETANRELEAFSYSVSHDLRAPLRAIDGFSHILDEDFSAELPAEARRYLGKISGNARKMGQLIDDLLAFSRLGRRPLEKTPIDVHGLVLKCIEDLATEMAGRPIEFEVGVLPPALADPMALRQLYANLFSNAIKFTSKVPHAVVEVGATRHDDEVVYFVKDNGAGFDMRYAGKLFGVFERLHSSDDYEGTGVGLAIVQRIVRRHGGRVWAAGAVNEGATFFFTL
jgi:PAS domain S-box-containing protein